MGANLLHLAQFASTAPAQFLIAGLWQGLLLTALAWTGLKAVPKISSSTRFVLWLVVFFFAALLPFSAVLHPASHEASGRIGAWASPAHVPAIWAVAIVAVWLCVSLFSMARLLASIYSLRVLALTSDPPPAGSLSPEIGAVLEKHSTGSGRPVEIRLSDRIDSPMVIGFFRPAILIPRWLWQKLAPAELHPVVMHELAHLERRDDWTNLLERFLRALFPLNPGLALAARQLYREREMACDDAVLDASIQPKDYAACLTNLAEKRLLRRVQSLAPGAWRRRSELAERVHRILKRNGMLRPLNSRPVIASFIAVYLCAGAALMRSPRLVSFTPVSGHGSSEALAATDTALFQPAHLTQTKAHLEPLSPAREIAAPRLIEASFHTSRIAAPLLQAHRSSAPASRRRRLVARPQSRTAQHRFAQPRFTAIRFVLPPAGFAEALFYQALLADTNGLRPAGAYSGTQLIFPVWNPSASLPAPLDEAPASSQSIHSRSYSGWIVIQL